MEKTRVLYIVGCGRSGSTILSRALGEIDGFFGAGEIRYLWAESHRGTRLCGCGQSLRECPTWSSILDELHAPNVDAEIERLAKYEEVIKTRHLPLLLNGSTARRAADKLGSYIEDLGRLYLTIGRRTGVRVIV